MKSLSKSEESEEVGNFIFKKTQLQNTAILKIFFISFSSGAIYQKLVIFTQ